VTGNGEREGLKILSYRAISRRASKPRGKRKPQRLPEYRQEYPPSLWDEDIVRAHGRP